MYPEEHPDSTPPRNFIRERVSLPGIFLAVVGGINVLAAGLLLMTGKQVAQQTPDEFEKQLQSLSPEQRRQVEELKQRGLTTEQLHNTVQTMAFTWGGVALVLGLVSVLGGIRMS